MAGLGAKAASGGGPLAGGIGFKSFDALKAHLGSPGAGKVWHPIVEQCQGNCTRSAIPAEMIHNTNNVVPVPKEVNQRLADLYSKKSEASGGKTIRDWLSSKSFKEQFDYGKKALDKALKGND